MKRAPSARFGDEGWRTQREVALDDAKEEGLLEMAGRPRLRQRRTDEQFEPMVRPAFRPRARIARE